MLLLRLQAANDDNNKDNGGDEMTEILPRKVVQEKLTLNTFR